MKINRTFVFEFGIHSQNPNMNFKKIKKKKEKEKMRELAVRNNEIYMIFENGEYIR